MLDFWQVRYKLLALDLDGTLLTNDGTVAEADRLAIARLRESGVEVTIVTGRMYSGATAAAQTIGVRGPIACLNGSQIVDTREATDMVHHRIAGAPAQRLRAILGEREIARYGMFAERIVGDPAGVPYEPYLRGWSDRFEHTDDVLEHQMWRDERGLSALVAVGAPGDIADTAQTIATEMSAVQVTSFDVRWFENTSALVVRADGTDKGVALTWLAEHHGIDLAQVVAVGDWLNDVPMLERAGRSFVMSHALEPVKAVASDVVPREANGGGVAEVIRRVFGL